MRWANTKTTKECQRTFLNKKHLFVKYLVCETKPVTLFETFLLNFMQAINLNLLLLNLLRSKYVVIHYILSIYWCLQAQIFVNPLTIMWICRIDNEDKTAAANRTIMDSIIRLLLSMKSLWEHLIICHALSCLCRAANKVFIIWCFQPVLNLLIHRYYAKEI